jgi:hypothetical protein
VQVYGDEAQTQLLYAITADRVIDFSAAYQVADATGRPLGVVNAVAYARSGGRSTRCHAMAGQCSPSGKRIPG